MNREPAIADGDGTALGIRPTCPPTIRGIHQIGVARTTIFFNLAPVFTMLLSTVLGVPPNAWQLFGAVAVILGVVFASGLMGIPTRARASQT